MTSPKRNVRSVDPVESRPVRFVLPYLPAREVFLAGSFNDWDPGALALSEVATGEWAVEVRLAPGEYEYLFVADGRWIADPNNPETRPNPYGGRNSVVHVIAPPPASRRPRPRRE